MCRTIVLLGLLGLISRTTSAAERPRVYIENAHGAIGFQIDGALKRALKSHKEIELVTAADAKKGIHALVEAKTTREGAQWVATIEVKEGATGAVKKTWRLKTKEIRKFSGVIEKKAWKELGPAILKAHPGQLPIEEKKQKNVAKGEDTPLPASVPEPVAEANTPDKPAEAAHSELKIDPSASTSAPPAPTPAPEGNALGATSVTAAITPESKPHAHNQTPFEIAAGMSFMTRSYKYHQDLFNVLRPYTLGGGPALDLDAAIFPGAFGTKGFVSNFGAEVSMQYLFGVQSSNSANNTFPTHALELIGQAKVRIPIGDHEIGLYGGYGRQTFSIDADSKGDQPGIPSVAYGFLRFGAEGRFVLFEHLSARARLSWRRVVTKGDIQSDNWFPGVTAVGVDALLGVGYEVLDGLEVQGAFDIRRYGLAFNPIPGDKNVAGGAVDQYLAGTLSVAYALGR